MRRTSIFLVALPLLGACSAAQMTEGLRQFNEAAAANLVSGESVSESGVKTGGFRVGQLVTGSISSPSEIDEFKMEGTAGQELILYASAPKQEGDHGWYHDFKIDVVSPEGSSVRGMKVGKGVPLENQHSDVIRLPSTGTYTVRVVGAGNSARGPYRFVFRPRQ